MDSNAGVQCNQRTVPKWDKKLADRFFKHLRRKVREKPVDDGKVVLLDLLDTAHANFIEQMREYSFDDFMRFLGTDCILRLQEQCQDHSLINVIIHEIPCGFATASLQCSAQQWTALAVIIADLEEQDSHLVVNTLEKQLPQLQLTSSDLGERWLTWLRILCLRLLQEDRVQVRRKALEYFLNHLSVAQLCRLSLLPEFLEATNRSELFDPEVENCLKEEHLEKFVANDNVELLLEALVAVSWQNVPLLLWIRSFKADQVKSVPQDLLIKFCLFVRGIDNYDYRNGVQAHVMRLFKTKLNGFPFEDYFMCIDSMFNKDDSYPLYQIIPYTLLEVKYQLQFKIYRGTDLEEHLYYFLEMLREEGLFKNRVIPKTKTLSKYKHCFWRLVLFDNLKFMDFYRKTYNVDTSLLQEGASLEKMQEHLLEKLECKTSEETSFLKARCVDLFTRNLKSWRQLEEQNLDPLELMERGTFEVIYTLISFLRNHKERIKDAKVLPALIARLFTIETRLNFLKFYLEPILNYALMNLTKEEFENILNNLLIQKKLVSLPNGELSISMYLKLLLHGEPTRGLARIEAFYAFNILDIAESNAKIRHMAIANLNTDKNAETRSKVFKELLKINEELSIEHPHYTENSEVHRQKMRIASALIDIEYSCDDHICLENLLLPSDHLGINLMHEFLVGKCVKNIDWVLRALPTLQPRQQQSYLSIAHIFIFNNLEKLNDENKLSEMLSLLLPMTMVPCYETRTLAQVILHKIALECELNSIHVPLAETVINSVETSLGKNLCELQCEPRLLLAEILLHISKELMDLSHYILSMTDVPYDELIKCYSNSYVYKKIKIARQAFRARKLLSSAQFAPSNNTFIERTLKKHKDYYEKYLEFCNSPEELTVVASMLDERTNFLRLVLICQRFGVDFLVLGEESHFEESDYGSLRISIVNSGSLGGFLQHPRRIVIYMENGIGIHIKSIANLNRRDFTVIMRKKEDWNVDLSMMCIEERAQKF